MIAYLQCSGKQMLSCSLDCYCLLGLLLQTEKESPQMIGYIPTPMFKVGIAKCVFTMHHQQVSKARYTLSYR